MTDIKPQDIIFVVLSTISLISLFAMFLTFSFQKSLRTYLNWKVIFLSISSFVSCISYLINFPTIKNVENEDLTCQFQGFVMIWFDLSIYIWAILINYSVYYHTTHFEKIKSDIIPCSWWLGDALFGYIFPFVYALVIFAFEQIGKNGNYCWIKSDESNKFSNYTVLVTYSIAWMLLVINLFYLSKIIYFIKKLPKDEIDYVRNEIFNLCLYSVIQFFITIPGTVYRILIFFNDLILLKEIMLYLSLYCYALMGLLISLAFGLNMHIFDKIYKFCYKSSNTKMINNYVEQISEYDINIRSSLFEDPDLSF